MQTRFLTGQKNIPWEKFGIIVSAKGGNSGKYISDFTSSQDINTCIPSIRRGKNGNKCVFIDDNGYSTYIEGGEGGVVVGDKYIYGGSSTFTANNNTYYIYGGQGFGAGGCSYIGDDIITCPIFHANNGADGCVILSYVSEKKKY